MKATVSFGAVALFFAHFKQIHNSLSVKNVYLRTRKK